MVAMSQPITIPWEQNFCSGFVFLGPQPSFLSGVFQEAALHHPSPVTKCIEGERGRVPELGFTRSLGDLMYLNCTKRYYIIDIRYMIYMMYVDTC